MQACGATSTTSATAAAGWPAAQLRERVRAAAPANAGRSIPVRYGGWRARRARLTLGDGTVVPCHPLVRTIATAPGGLGAEVIDLGRGTPEEFEGKYDKARALGAVGFLIAGPLAGHVVAGSSGRMEEDGIPALGVTPETAARLARTADGFARATIVIETEEAPAETETLCA
jgi:hypothetical protein